MNVIRHSETIDGDEDGGACGRVFKGQGFGPDALCNALGFRATETKAIEADGVGRGDVFLGYAYLEGFGHRLRPCGDQDQGERDDQ